MSYSPHKDVICNIDPTLRVFHVGGRGSGIGPVECLLRLGESLSLLVFEADLNSGDIIWNDFARLFEERANKYGIKHSVIPCCLSKCVGKKEFNINVSSMSSSLYKMSPDAKNYTRLDGSLYGGMRRLIVGEICQPRRIVEIEVTTLDELYDNHVVQTPHFLSMDTQGSDYDILEGASKALQGELLGVVTEVLYREFYDGQKLFDDQFAFLRKHQFSLFELYNTEYWHSGPIVGKGFLTTNEALFLRDFQYFVRKDKAPFPLLSNLSKLAIVAYCFQRHSYAFEILEYIMNNWRSEWEIFIKQSSARYIHDLDKFYWKVMTRKSQLEKVPTYSEYMAMCKSAQTVQRLKTFPIFSVAYNLNLKMILDKLRLLRGESEYHE